MKIKKIQVVTIIIPVSKPKTKSMRKGWSEQNPRARPINKYPEFSKINGFTPNNFFHQNQWVQIIAEDGTWGLGKTISNQSILYLINQYFAPLLEGRDCMAMEFLNDLMWRSAQNFGAAGLSALAQSAIDIALWDLKGKLLKQPVYKLIGGPCRDKILLYATSDDFDWSKELGFKHFKISSNKCPLKKNLSPQKIKKDSYVM